MHTCPARLPLGRGMPVWRRCVGTQDTGIAEKKNGQRKRSLDGAATLESGSSRNTTPSALLLLPPRPPLLFPSRRRPEAEGRGKRNCTAHRRVVARHAATDMRRMHTETKRGGSNDGLIASRRLAAHARKHPSVQRTPKYVVGEEAEGGVRKYAPATFFDAAFPSNKGRPVLPWLGLCPQGVVGREHAACYDRRLCRCRAVAASIAAVAAVRGSCQRLLEAAEECAPRRAVGRGGGSD